MHDVSLFDQRRDRLSQTENSAIDSHIERFLAQQGGSVVIDYARMSSRAEPTFEQLERMKANLMRGILLSDSYPDNIRQIVDAHERIQSWSSGMSR